VIIYIYLFLVFLVPAQAISLTEKGPNPVSINDDHLDLLRKEVEALRSLLDEKRQDNLKHRGDLKLRFKETLEKAAIMLKAIDNALRDKAGVDDDIDSKIRVFNDLMEELKELVKQNELQEGLQLQTPPPPSRASTSSPAHPRRRKVVDPSTKSLSRSNTTGPKGNIYYQYDDTEADESNVEDDSQEKISKTSRPHKPTSSQHGAPKSIPAPNNPRDEPFVD
jgi:hypothetical protein